MLSPQKGDKMKYLIIILLTLASFSCTTVFKKTPKPDNKNNQTIYFQDVDANQDGTVTKEEVDQYNNSKNAKTNISTPAYVASAILIISVLGCIILVRKKKQQE